MGGRKSSEPGLKSVVEQQSGRLRGLAVEVQNYVKLFEGQMSPSQRGIVRGWSQTIDSIADELTLVVNTERDPRQSLGRLGALTLSTVAVASFVIEQVNAGYEFLENIGEPGRIESIVREIHEGVAEIEEADDGSVRDPAVDDERQVADTLWKATIGHFGSLIGAVEALEENTFQVTPTGQIVVPNPGAEQIEVSSSMTEGLDGDLVVRLLREEVVRARALIDAGPA